MKIDEICDALLNALREKEYSESTIFNYEGVIRRFKSFCTEKNVTEYSTEIGEAYANDVISDKTGKFSSNRYFTQGRFFRLVDSYYRTGEFDFSFEKAGILIPDNDQHKLIYKKFQEFLNQNLDNVNTIHFYEYGMYKLLQYMDETGVYDINNLNSKIIISYIKNNKQNRQRGILCELRKIFIFLKRDDLTHAIAGLRAPRTKKIIPILDDEELSRIMSVIESGDISKRDTAIVMLGLSCGIRACDLLNLRLSNFDWENDIIIFTQTKTGNVVRLPLTEKVGNAIARYIVEERPTIDDDHVFLRSLAPYKPLKDHASCHSIIKKVFKKANIDVSNRICGMHMLRHNAASTMVKNEIPIETIAAILGHSTPDTTDIYITTDVMKLKTLVLPFGSISGVVYHE